MDETMKEYLERCEKAISEMQDIAKKFDTSQAESVRLRGKIEGVKLARDYAKEMFAGLLEAS